MKLGEAIRLARLQKDVRVPDDVLIQWVNEAEGMIQTDIMLVNIHDIMTYTRSDIETTLLVRPPHDRMYISYLLAKIDLYNADYERYGYSKKAFDDDYNAFARWFIDAYRPADAMEEDT